jgi:hypothetical protein
MGWQASAGFSIARLRLGVEYQGQFTRVGAGKFVNDQSLEIMHVPGQFVVSLQKSF